MNKNDVENQIKEIKRQLNLGNASLMIGSGFSKNANRDSQNTPYPPSWNELKQVFVDRLYETYSVQYREKMYETKNVLQLAQEYEAEYKRAGLNALLMQLIPDSALIPNEIYNNLLKLPWRDIFTTNYDTLLERAANNVLLRKYDVVLDGRDLPFSEKPRIVKLHGSFQTEATHLIITEEDYRTYPIKYAPFVNTVIQSIMETSFCLIGFSGTDPNFLAWIGWVRDHLNRSMPPIYLIGVLKLSDSENQVLREKNIIPVDLSIGSETEDHKTLLSNFINKLIDKTPKEAWPPAENTFKWSVEFWQGDDEKKKNIVNQLIEKWRMERENYPHWVILPHKKRAVLYDDFKIWDGTVCFCQKMDYPSNIQFLYEYNWRLEHCLCPICNDWIPAYEKVLKSYNPYEIADSFFDNDIITIQDDSEKKLIKQKWIGLVFAVLRWCREEHDSERWMQYAVLLEKIVYVDSNLANRYYYEKALWLLSKPNIEKLEKHLIDWKNYLDSSSEWNIKYASIIAELNSVDEAGAIYNSMLPIIRKSIPKDAKKNDYYALGLEGIAITSLLLYSHHKKVIPSPHVPGRQAKIQNTQTYHSKNIKNNNAVLPVSNDNSSKNPSTEDICDDIRERLGELRQYDCNPFDELDYFKAILSCSKFQFSPDNRKRCFDFTVTTQFFGSNVSEDVVASFQLIRFFEETGIPLHMGSFNIADPTLASAIERVVHFSPVLAFSMFSRIGERGNTSCESFFSQRHIHCFSKEKVSTLLDDFCQEAHYLITMKNENLCCYYDNIFIRILKVLLESISRLVSKTDNDRKQKVFNLILDFHESKINRKYEIYRILWKNLLQRTFEAMGPNFLYKNILSLLQLPLPLSESDRTFYRSPFLDILWHGFTVSPDDCSSEIKTCITLWLDRLNNKDKFIYQQALLVLNSCLTLGVLTNDQKECFVRILEQHKGPDGLPEIPGFHKWAILSFPFSNDTKGVFIDKLCKYYGDQDFQFDIGMNISFGPVLVEMCNNLLANCSVLKSSSRQYFDLPFLFAEKIFHAIVESWKKSKVFLISNAQKEEDNFLCDEIKNKVSNQIVAVEQILAEVLIPIYKKHKCSLDEISQFLQEIRELSSCILPRISLLNTNSLYDDELINEMIGETSKSDPKIFETYGYAIYCSFYFYSLGLGPKPPDCFILILLNSIGMKSDITVRRACSFLGSLLDVITLTKDQENLFAIYLEQLITETSYQNEKSKFAIEERDDFRQSAAFLAASFHQYSKKQGKEFAVLQEWYNICHSADEFPILRNTWIEVENADK